MRPQATSVSGLKLLVYEATSVCDLKILFCFSKVCPILSFVSIPLGILFCICQCLKSMYLTYIIFISMSVFYCQLIHSCVICLYMYINNIYICIIYDITHIAFNFSVCPPFLFIHRWLGEVV